MCLRTEIIGEIIESTGAAIPLQKLVKTSGAEIKEKPRYYQRLSVHEQKGDDWADAGRGVARTIFENEHPPGGCIPRQSRISGVFPQRCSTMPIYRIRSCILTASVSRLSARGKEVSRIRSKVSLRPPLSHASRPGIQAKQRRF